MLEELKNRVFEANIELVKKGLVIYTWGNVSGISEDRKYVVIKPSGVEYETMKPEDMVVVDIVSGGVVEGKYRPSSDTSTHLEIYRRHSEIGGIVHTHSTMGVVFAQAGMDIPALGTTHADYFYGPIPCTRSLSEYEINNNYELNTGVVINETIGNNDPMRIPGIVVRNHGPFAWGKNPEKAVYNAVVLETVAQMAWNTLMLNGSVQSCPQFLLDKHYNRKHGKGAYYGQVSGFSAD